MAMFEIHCVDEQIKALPTVGTASGSVASFDTDMTENLVSCVCEVASGSSEINVSACGKNLFPYGSVSGVASEEKLITLPAGTYTLSALITSSDIDGTESYIIVYCVDSTDARFRLTRNTRQSYTFTITAPSNRIRFYAGYNSSQSTGDSFTYADVQIERSTATDFEPYNGNTYNISFGETLSGDGSFDVLSGILTRADDTTKQLSANYIQALNGLNNIWCDTNGDTSVKYILSVGKAIS